MYLRPHHFQAAQRHAQHLDRRTGKWDVHHNWGLREGALDTDALANYRCVVRSLAGRLRDGTAVVIPEDGDLAAVDLRPALEEATGVTVFLAVPVVNLSKANVSGDGTGDGARYHVDSQELEDENTGVNPQPVLVRRLNVRLLLSTDDHTGYEVLPVAHFEKSTEAGARPQLDTAYIPPLLACDAWPPLAAGILQSSYDRIGRKIEVLASQLAGRGLVLDSQNQGDALLFAQLRELNEAYAVLGVKAFAPGVHPFDAYVELCRVVGRLSVFGPTRRPPLLPRYDHDDLGGCFYAVKRHLDDLLDLLVEPAYKERPFFGTGLRMQVALEPAWLESAWQLYVGVQGNLEPEETVRLLTGPGQLDMKIGSSDRADIIFRSGQAGLRFEYERQPPRTLPSTPGLIYFKISREANPAEWQHVQRSLTLALRLNENRVAGNIQGQRTLTIKAGGQTTALQFTLYVVPEGAA
jgi:type VI secretion system protein ImpJ